MSTCFIQIIKCLYNNAPPLDAFTTPFTSNDPDSFKRIYKSPDRVGIHWFHLLIHSLLSFVLIRIDHSLFEGSWIIVICIGYNDISFIPSGQSNCPPTTMRFRYILIQNCGLFFFFFCSIFIRFFSLVNCCYWWFVLSFIFPPFLFRLTWLSLVLHGLFFFSFDCSLFFLFLWL